MKSSEVWSTLQVCPLLPDTTGEHVAAIQKVAGLKGCMGSRDTGWQPIAAARGYRYIDGAFHGDTESVIKCCTRPQGLQPPRLSS